jgi:hypothetical protein
MAGRDLLKRAEIGFDVVVLLVAGATMLITGTLLFPVAAGLLPYYENGLYGLLLFIFALQMITLGRTPFGDAPRSKVLLATGCAIAATGIVTCFIPDIFSRVPRIILSICFGPGSVALLLQMIFSRDKLPKWRKCGGVFLHLIAGCTVVYILSALIGLLIFRQNLLSTSITAVVALLSGTSLIYLAVTLHRIYSAYPEAVREPEGDLDLPIDRAMILLTGIFMVLLGLLLVPVSLGRLPFSGSAQIGLLMIILALQMLSTGSSPIGPFPRTWLMIIVGLSFASLGVISCIIPGLLVSPLTVLIGGLNLLGGGLMLKRIFTPMIKGAGRETGPDPAILVRLNLVQVTMNVVSIMFGTSMLVHNLIPGLVIGVILAANGGLLLYLMRIMYVIDAMKKEAGRSAV